MDYSGIVASARQSRAFTLGIRDQTSAKTSRLMKSIDRSSPSRSNTFGAFQDSPAQRFSFSRALPTISSALRASMILTRSTPRALRKAEDMGRNESGDCERIQWFRGEGRFFQGA